MEAFNRFSIIIVLLIKCSALGVIMLCIGAWGISASGIVPSRGLPIFEFEMIVTCGICVVIELLTSWYMLHVPAYVEPPKPIGWRPPIEDERSKHDGPFM